MAYKYVRLTWKPGMYENPDPNNGTVLEHREVAAQLLQRPLTAIEVVHHIDEDKKNNDPDNLIIFRTVADHSAHHAGGELIPHDDGTFSAERKPAKPPRILIDKRCIDCEVSIQSENNRCWDCFTKYSRHGGQGWI